MPNGKIRVGIIGAGANTRLRHIPGLKAQKGVEVVAVANRTRESGQRVASEFDIPTVCDDWQQIIDDDTIDAVCIGTWPYMHCTLTLAALDAGKHVLVEARMAATADEAHDMLDAAKSNPDLVTQIVPAPHTLELDRHIIDLISDGFIGDPVAVDMRVTTGKLADYDAPKHWRHDPHLSGNNILTMGIFYEAMMRWLGPATHVAAMARTVVKSRLDEEGRRVAIQIPDHVDILADLAIGAQARMNFSAVSGFAPTEDTWIFGTEGALRIDAKRVLYGGKRGDPELRAVDIPKETRIGWRVEEEFINAVRGLEQVTRTNFYDGVAYMEFTDAVNKAFKTGATVPVGRV
ncbi:MAG: Gfo/Idh/MocA family oxidoreductase [Chloroflexi bacterium]|nr:Gfo/Idh/MocA family oxidoreductase [Chloroflexota bacterium]